MGKNYYIIILVSVVIFLAGCSSVSASPAAKIVGGMVTNVASTLFKRMWSLKPTTKTGISSRSMMKFESGYTVETVFDGSKLGIEPYSVEVSPDGEILILDNENSNIHKISTPLSKYSRLKLVAGSPEGYTGHVDGKLREAKLNHPKGLAVDDNGNVYVADTMNMAIRKISDAGVVTIAGGKLGRGGSHIDGPSEDAKFSDDFDVVYIGSSCSLLVIDRGNQAIREIQLHEDDCMRQDDSNLHLGIVVLAAACFFGYMLALLQRRVASIFSYSTEPKAAHVMGMPPGAYQRPPPSKSIRPPLIPPEEDYDKEEEGIFTSFGKLVVYATSSVFELFGSLLPGFRKKPIYHHNPQPQHRHPSLHGWPVQESFVIPHDDAPPPIDPREQPTPRKSYIDKSRQFKQSSQPYYGGWNGEYHPNHHHQPVAAPPVNHHHHQKHQPSSPRTFYEPESGETNEIVFGAVQEQDGRREAMVIKAVDYADPIYSSSNNNNQNLRSRSYNYMSYSYGY